MTIKEVEKQTGLTAKSIRFYESKGLVCVGRNKVNSYRNYSQEEVNILKKIKLFRYLDFNIEEIKQLFDMQETQMKDVLRKKAEVLWEKSDVCKRKQEICLALAKDYQDHPQAIDDCIDVIEFLESDETTETLRDMTTPNLSHTIIRSLIFLGPILWLFINIQWQKYDILIINSICAIIGTICLTINWAFYVVQYRYHRNRVKKQNRLNALLLPMLVASIVLMFAVFIGIDMLIIKVLSPDGWLFYELHAFAGIALIWLIVIPVILLSAWLLLKLGMRTIKQMEDMNDLLYVWNRLGKWRLTAVVIWVIGLYCCMTSVTFVTENSIVYCSPTHPTGVEYAYSDVDEIVTGFGDKVLTLKEYKKNGNFFYQIQVDGKKVVFHAPTVNGEIKRYKDDTYLELEDFDQKLVELGVSKKADSDGYENCDLDKQYVDRFLRIIELNSFEKQR